MENFAIVLGITGGILGIAAFVGQWLVAVFKYIHISVKFERLTSESGAYSAQIILENKSILRKRVDYAALLISPENESTSYTLQKISEALNAPRNFENDNSFLRSELSVPKYMEDGSRAIIPLPFIFSEQLYITEQTECSYSLDASKLEKNRLYSLKLLVQQRFLFRTRRRIVQVLMDVE